MSNLKLNEKQKMAVIHNKGPMLVLAGPGSGKTTVILYRIKTLIEKYGVNPKDILVITFTKAAAEEMNNRFKSIDEFNYGYVSFGTFHSFFFRILRSAYGYTLDNILKEEEKKNIIKNILISMKMYSEDGDEIAKNITSEISFIKNELLNAEYYSSLNCGADDFRKIFNTYEKYKAENNKIDFDDMIVKCYHLLMQNNNVLSNWRKRYNYILIDEFQDINKAQYECIKLLSGKNGNLFVVGDDDQSIYKFRGARPEFLLKFPDEFENTEKIILDINYRSTEQIIKLCNVVIDSNKNRYKKFIKGTKKNGNIPVLLNPYDISEEAILIAKKIKKNQDKTPFNKIAVIYRTNIQSRAIVDAFMDLNIPFQVKDEVPALYEHWVAKDMVAYLTLALDVKRDECFKRIANKPNRYISKSSIYAAQKNKKDEESLINALYNMDELKKWQLIRVEELIYQLNTLKKKNTYDAFKYIRKVMNYDNYINDYANYRKMSPKGLFEVLEEIQESSKGYDKIEEYLEHVENVIFDTKEKKGLKRELNGVTLSTIHSAKGLEFDIVFVTSVVEGVIPYEKSRSFDEIEEERRLFYVAMTRARKQLYISIVKSRYEQKTTPSRFLNGIVKERKN